MEFRITKRNDLVTRLLADINDDKFNPMTPDEEITAFENRDANREEIINRNLRFVFSIAKEYSNSPDMICENFSNGVEGLIKSIDNFDITRGFRFYSFAVHYIRLHIISANTELGNIVRSSNNKILPKVKEFKTRYFVSNGRYPTDNEIADYLNEVYGIDVKYMGEIHGSTITHLDCKVKEDSDDDMTEIGEVAIATSSHNLVEDTIESDHNKEMVRILMNCEDLKPKEKEVLEYIYFKGMKYKSISQILGMTREGVRQVEKRALSKLRRYMKTIM